MKNKVTIITVNYNLTEFVMSCIESVHKFVADLTYDIIVVDNASTDREIEKLNSIYPEVKLFILDYNRGFGYANNYAMKNCDSDYYVILNPDTIFLENSLIKIINFLDRNPQYGAVGALIEDVENNLQFSYDKFPNLKRIIKDELGLWKTTLKNFREGINNPVNNKEVVEADWITGAFMVVPRTVYERTGGFDEDFFLYAEDVDWCFRIREAGWKIGCYLKTRIKHEFGKSTKRDYSDFMLLRNTGRIIYMKKHFPLSKQIIAHFICVISIIIRMLIVSLKPKVDYRQQRLIGYVKSLFIYLLPCTIKQRRD